MGMEVTCHGTCWKPAACDMSRRRSAWGSSASLARTYKSPQRWVLDPTEAGGLGVARASLGRSGHKAETAEKLPLLTLIRRDLASAPIRNSPL